MVRNKSRYHSEQCILQDVCVSRNGLSFLMLHNMFGATCMYSWQSWDWETQTCVLGFIEHIVCSHFFGVQGPKDFLSASTHRYSYVFFCLSFCSFMCTFILLCVCVCVWCAVLCLFLPNFTCACSVGVAFTVQYFHEC